MPVDAHEAAEAEASRWASIALIAQVSPPARAQLTACGMCEELLGLPSDILIPLIKEMVYARSLAAHESVLAFKPPEVEARLLSPRAILSPAQSSDVVETDMPTCDVDGNIVLLVVARYQEDITWLERLPERVTFHVLQKHALQPELPNDAQTLLPNVGRESHSYLHHLKALKEKVHATTAANLPPWIVCTQADPFEHNEHFLQDIATLMVPCHGQAALALADFVPLGLWSGGERQIYCDASGAPHQAKLLPIGRVWRALFDERPMPQWLRFTPGALFAIPRRVLLRTPMGTFERALQTDCGLCTDVDPISGHVFERLWEYLFDGA